MIRVAFVIGDYPPAEFKLRADTATAYSSADVEVGILRVPARPFDGLTPAEIQAAAPIFHESFRQAEREGYDAVVPLGMLDIGVDGGRSAVDIPVIAPLQAALHVAALLGDPDWWVRFSAKECLETMGSEVWPVLVRSLDSPDRFVRNGAAEVFQNLGLLDSLILMEAATDDPASAKIEMLRRITVAGGLRLTDSLIERAGTVVGPRVRRLLTTIGLEHVQAA